MRRARCAPYQGTAPHLDREVPPIGDVLRKQKETRLLLCVVGQSTPERAWTCCGITAPFWQSGQFAGSERERGWGSANPATHPSRDASASAALTWVGAHDAKGPSALATTQRKSHLYGYEVLKACLGFGRVVGRELGHKRAIGMEASIVAPPRALKIALTFGARRSTVLTADGPPAVQMPMRALAEFLGGTRFVRASGLS